MVSGLYRGQHSIEWQAFLDTNCGRELGTNSKKKATHCLCNAGQIFVKTSDISGKTFSH